VCGTTCRCVSCRLVPIRVAITLCVTDAPSSAIFATQLRHGLASAGRSAVFGGVLLAGIEGIGIMITRLTAPPPPPGLDDMLTQSPAGLAQTKMPASSTAPPVMPVELDAEAPPTSIFGVEPAASTNASTPPTSGRAAGGGWFGGLFGSGDGGAARKAAQSPVRSTEQPVMPDFGTGSSSKDSSSGQGFTFR
jgi:mitochondrial import inner membrane translocase subunit TIM17